MKDRILQGLEKIEQEEDVRILYAVESGSRAWDFPSTDSDYDVRFLYVHKPSWYLSVFEGRDVIERPIVDLLDFSGWDLRKALQLFSKSNPPLLEWLQSPIVYWEKFSAADRIRRASPLIFSPKSCLYHYLHMAEGNYRDYLLGDRVKSKKYFYVMRPVFSCLWIEKHKTMPPLEFEVLLKELVPAGALRGKIEELLARKKAGEELEAEPKIAILNEYLDRQIIHLKEAVHSIPPRADFQRSDLDRLFQDSLKEVWGPNY